MPVDGRFSIREAAAGDAPALAALHVATFRETHAPAQGPSVEIRESQWRQLLRDAQGPTFCFLVESFPAEPVGFAFGKPYSHPDQPDFEGQLNKIYLLRAFHRRGLGRRLVGEVARRFLREGISSMLLFGDAGNPSNGFYERLGADRLYGASGEFHGGYGWRSLRRLADICPVAD